MHFKVSYIPTHSLIIVHSLLFTLNECIKDGCNLLTSLLLVYYSLFMYKEWEVENEKKDYG